MALDAVHEDVKAELGRQIHQLHQLLHGGGADQMAVGLEQRPQVEDTDVVEAQSGDLGQVRADVVRIDVVPCVEPAATWGVVDAEAEFGDGRGRADGVLLGASDTPRSLPVANVSTTMDDNE
ncbi:hypothetical protein [Streptomyces fuscichromogenes]|uniref:Uncharacterized protein n=1 Tax=Streptomyces fuscichromogenes TaxID=1324013 RepID=A0A917UK11_9ACTN|nr:hypothetical protein GCM10011578_014980 [Streptomyces fuscichromogenes]